VINASASWRPSQPLLGELLDAPAKRFDTRHDVESFDRHVGGEGVPLEAIEGKVLLAPGGDVSRRRGPLRPFQPIRVRGRRFQAPEGGLLQRPEPPLGEGQVPGLEAR
jgi:hypothetical protein